MADDKKKSKVQNAATEQAILNEMLANIKTKADTLQKSLDSYLNTSQVSMFNIPNDIPTLERVLDRFFKTNNIKDIYDLVDHKPNLLKSALDFVKIPVKKGSRADYYNSQMALNNIINNLGEYKQLETYTKLELIKIKENLIIGSNAEKTGATTTVSNKDGFKNYVKKAQIISDCAAAYYKIISYTGGFELDIHNLPNAIENLQNSKHAIAGPSSLVAEKQNADEHDTSYENDRFEVGGEEYIAKLNKYAHDCVVQDISQRKFVCYHKAILHRIKYNICINDATKTPANRDLNCEPEQHAYEISRANCDTHFPMITVHDLLTEEVLSKIEKVYVTREDNKIDFGSIKDGLNEYNRIGLFLYENNPQPLLGLESYDTGSEKVRGKVAETMKEAADVLGMEQKQLLLGEEGGFTNQLLLGDAHQEL